MIIIIFPHRQRKSQAGGLGLWLRGWVSEAQTSRPRSYKETQSWLFYSYRPRRGPGPAWGGDSESGGGAAAEISTEGWLPHTVRGLSGQWQLGGEDPGPGHRHQRLQPHPGAGWGHARVFCHMWRQTDTDDKVSTKTSYFLDIPCNKSIYVLSVRRMSDFVQIQY